MLTFLPGPIHGVISLLLLALNTIFWTFFLFTVTFLKIIIPIPAWRSLCGKVLNQIATSWVFFNNLNIALTKRIKWDVKGLSSLKPDGWYLVLSNHQSWMDIVVLQKVLFRKVPFLKFFLKNELIWVPLLGQAWWALDFPFMKRFSKDYLKKNPHMKGKDMETTRKACEKFKNIPVSIMNFVEGTRFTRDKQKQQNSPYRNLLKPKAAGIAFVMGAMGDQLEHILNVTIVYPNNNNSFWAFLCGKVRDIRVRVDSVPVTGDLIGDYFNDLEYREKFQNWLNNMWNEKDGQIALLTGQKAITAGDY